MNGPVFVSAKRASENVSLAKIINTYWHNVQKGRLISNGLGFETVTEKERGREREFYEGGT